VKSGAYEMGAKKTNNKNVILQSHGGGIGRSGEDTGVTDFQ
jgi:hypothetical protein